MECVIKKIDSVKCLLFDFDYTLADSSEGIIECINHAFTMLGMPAQNPDDIRKTIGKSVIETFEVFAGHSCGKSVDEFRKIFRSKGQSQVGF